GELLPIETVENRLLATAHLSERLIFNLPEAVITHVRLKVLTRPPNDLRFTDDSILWFLPAPEYYEYRARQRSPRGWHGPSGGGMAHVYLARSLVPWSEELDRLERRIDSEEWMPRLRLIERVSRERRAVAP
ncbi:MAG: hypothetical protein ACREC5_05295, partial [Thermoplasmata archaeon]